MRPEIHTKHEKYGLAFLCETLKIPTLNFCQFSTNRYGRRAHYTHPRWLDQNLLLVSAISRRKSLRWPTKLVIFLSMCDVIPYYVSICLCTVVQRNKQPRKRFLVSFRQIFEEARKSLKLLNNLLKFPPFFTLFFIVVYITGFLKMEGICASPILAWKQSDDTSEQNCY